MVNNFRGFQKMSNFKGHIKPLARKANSKFLAFFKTWELASCDPQFSLSSYLAKGNRQISLLLWSDFCTKQEHFRPGSDDELFLSRTVFELRPTQMYSMYLVRLMKSSASEPGLSHIFVVCDIFKIFHSLHGAADPFNNLRKTFSTTQTTQTELLFLT